MNILHKYVLKETTTSFLFGLLIFTFIFLTDKLFELVDLIITKGVPPEKVLLLLLYILPSFIAITVPMAVLLSTLLSFGRLMSENEITVVKSSGINAKMLMRPVILGALFISIILVIFNDQILPRANYSFKTLYFDIISKRASIVIKDHQFINEFDGYVFYAENQDKMTSKLNNILVYALEIKDEPLRIITAKSGKVVSDSRTRRILLKLYNGVIHSLNKKKEEGKYEQIFFNSYDIDLDINRTLSSSTAFDINKSEREMGIFELKEYIDTNKNHIANNNKYFDVELHKKITIPFAALTFALIGIPLGMLVKRGGRTAGFGISLVLIFIYYLLLVLAETIGSKNIINPALSMWLPNIIMGIIGLIFIQKTKY